jgi:Trk K+ transport system NAD-binding subunit
MTQDEIIEMVREAGFSIANGIVTGGVTDVKRFAKLVAEREREACAKIADEWAVGWPHPSQVIAERIRAKGQA